MSNNISTMYTKSQNLKAGRKGYVAWKTEKETAICGVYLGIHTYNQNFGKL